MYTVLEVQVIPGKFRKKKKKEVCMHYEKNIKKTWIRKKSTHSIPKLCFCYVKWFV